MNPPDANTLAPPGRVLGAMLVAAALELLAWLWLWPERALIGGWYGRAELWRAVHTLTLGVMGLSLFGVGWQLVPILTARPWPAPLAPALNGALVLGLAGLLASQRGTAGAFGAALAVTAVVVRAVLVLVAVGRARGRPVVRAWVAAAELCALGGVGLGLVLWWGRAGTPVLADPLWGIALHLRLLLGGWFGAWIVGAGAVLLPMFAVSREPSARVLAVALACWMIGLIGGLAPVWGVGAALALGSLYGSLRGGARRGPALLQARLGLLGALAGGLGLGLGGLDGRGTAAFVAVVLGILPLLRGVAQRIGPFLAWSHATQGALRGAPSVTRFAAERLHGVQLALSWGGGLWLVLAREAPISPRPALVLLLLGAFVQLVILGRAALFAALLRWPTGGGDVAG